MLPGTCAVPKPTWSHQRRRPELVSPAPSPHRGPPSPLAPTPPSKHKTLLRVQTSDVQPHGQAHRHTRGHPRQVRQPAGASSSARATARAPTRERPGPEEGTAGRGSGETETERDEGSETGSQDGERADADADADRQTDTSAQAHPGRESQREGDTERPTERRKAGDGQGTGDGIPSETDTLAQTVTHRRERPVRKGGGVSLGPGEPRLDAVPWGWQSPVGTPRLPRSRGLKGPLRLGSLRRDPAPAPRPEGECGRERACECVGGRRWGRVDWGGRVDTHSGGGRVWRPGLWKPVRSSCCLSLSPSFSVSLTCGFRLLTCLGCGGCVCVWGGGREGVCVCVCVCVCVVRPRLRETARLPARVRLGVGLGPRPRPELPEACQGSPRQRPPRLRPRRSSGFLDAERKPRGWRAARRQPRSAAGVGRPGHPT